MSADSTSHRTHTPSALPPGTRLGEFELLSVLGVGGFGIVYLAFDHALEREVAIKEYMPATLAGRTETMHVTLRAHSDAESFGLGLKSFVNEAKLLARFDHPSLLKVHRFWEANGTAYMAMPVLRGRNLKEIRSEMSGPPDEAWMRRILLPLLGAVEKLHSEGVYHRDIAPDNIQIESDGRPVLLDFGAARRVLSDKSQLLTAILKPSYAPIEQYGEAGAVKQGPWTDLYALGATLHYLLLGRPPAPATARTVHDEGSSLSTDILPGCSEGFLRTIDWMLCPRPTDRPQSVAEVRQVLDGTARLPAPRVAQSAPVHAERTSLQNPRQASGSVDLAVDEEATQIFAREDAPALAAQAAWTEQDRLPIESQPGMAGFEKTVLVRKADAPTPPVDFSADSVLPLAPDSTAAGDARRSKMPLVGAIVAVAALLLGAWMWVQRDAPATSSEPARAPAAAAAAAAVTESAPLVAAPSNIAASAPAPAASVAVALPSAASEAMATATSATSAAPAASQPAPDRAAQPVLVPAAAPTQRAEAPARMPARTSETTRLRRESPAPERTTAPAAAPAAAVPAGPGPSCGPREGVRYLVCMERECAGAEFAGHPACRRWKP
jgi:serine/threonine protein kinase